MKNFQSKNFGELQKLNQYVFAPEGTSINIEGKLFLGDQLGLSSMEVSLNKDAAGNGMPFYHRHNKNEELYIFISGQGEMSIDDEIIPVQEGSVVRIQPEAKRAWWNTGDSDLTYIVIQAPAGGLQAAGVEDGEILEGSVPWN
jgi:mannose-6-phosphate isomerase-like protein (cupin superfamily)